jgi:2-polyprenyl-3-methyl-5-hydroxy-6-metoxy-1,4-benzoquinol methylase
VGRGYDYDYRTTFHIFEYRRCKQCDVVYPNYEPVHGQLDKVYKKSYWHDRKRFVYRTSLKKQLQFRAGRLIKRLAVLASEKPRFKLLDIGSGRGDLFWILRDKFPNGDYYSVDLTYEIELPGVKHFKGYFEDCDFAGKKFDVITSQHSIEHVYSPRDYLLKAASLLNDDGFIFIATPNVDALEFKIFRKKLYCAGYSVPRHLSLFNERSFRILVDSINNLQLEKLNYFFTIHHWAGMIHHIAYNKTRSDKTDRYLNYNNVLLSVPLYLFDLARYHMGFKTGVLEAALTKVRK